MLLVTGITGHSGSYFLLELMKHNYRGPIRCVLRETSDTTLLDQSGLWIEKVYGNLDDQKFVNQVMLGVDTVVHIASMHYSTNMILAAVKNKVRRAIVVHSTDIYSKYKRASKEIKAIEQTIKNIIKVNKSSIGLIYLRPTMIYGYSNDRNMMTFIKMVDRLRVVPIVHQGENLLQPVNGRDLGKAYFQVLAKATMLNGDFILSGEKPISVKELLELISIHLGKKTKFVSVTLKTGVWMARILKICSLGKKDYIEKVQHMAEDRSFSHRKAAETFGYAPMPLSKGLRLEIEEYTMKVPKDLEAIKI